MKVWYCDYPRAQRTVATAVTFADLVSAGYQRWVEQRKEWTSGTRPAQPRHRQLCVALGL